jgi:dienelactone hydrolase
MADVLLFHSVYGRRPAEAVIADRLRADGHRVTVPDLFGGRTAPTVEEGFAILEEVGWAAVAGRAEAAAADLPPETVLAGVSMGAGVAGHLWQQRPAASGVLLLHGVCELPAQPRPGQPVQLHLAEPDPFEEEEFVADWLAQAASISLVMEVFRYPGAGHYFLDAALPDHDAAAAALAEERIRAFLSRIDG